MWAPCLQWLSYLLRKPRQSRKCKKVMSSSEHHCWGTRLLPLISATAATCLNETRYKKTRRLNRSRGNEQRTHPGSCACQDQPWVQCMGGTENSKKKKIQGCHSLLVSLTLGWLLQAEDFRKNCTLPNTSGFKETEKNIWQASWPPYALLNLRWEQPHQSKWDFQGKRALAHDDVRQCEVTQDSQGLTTQFISNKYLLFPDSIPVPWYWLAFNWTRLKSENLPNYHVFILS